MDRNETGRTLSTPNLECVGEVGLEEGGSDDGFQGHQGGDGFDGDGDGFHATMSGNSTTPIRYHVTCTCKEPRER